jgi:4a-hydroxytetrahydrobiopterin dehydratase
MTALLQQHCRPLSGPPLAPAEWPPLLAQVSGWAVVDGLLQREFRFADYPATIAFVNAVAALAEREDHHPDLLVTWGRCTVRWHTHSVGGLSLNDFICAAHVDALQP